MRSLISLALVVAFQAPSTPVNLEVKGKLGDRYRYALESVIKGVTLTGEIQLRAELEERLSKIGTTEWEWTTTFSRVRPTASGAFKGAEESMAEMEGMTTVSIQDRRGAVLRTRVENIEVKSRGSANVVLPPKPVSVGDTWTAPIEAGGQVFTITYQFAERTRLEGIDVARIEGQFVDQKAKAVEPTTFWVDVATGKMVRARALTEVEVQGQKMQITYRIDRLPISQ